jgi:iron-sulfur cluster repair protein YtfE (RIC family)
LLHAAPRTCGEFNDSNLHTEAMMETTLIPAAHIAPQPATASATTAPVIARYDGYRAVHKAIRLFMTDTLSRVGRADPFDAAEVAGALAQVGELMDLCGLHIKDENDFIHPALERAQPGSPARIAAEHVAHHEAIADLRDLAAFTANTRDEARSTALFRLYHALALFVAENFEHMHVEETAHNAVLWAHYSDAELIAIERELVASIPPQAMFKALHWFLPALNAPERFEMLRGMQAGMPPEAFLGVMDIARRTLSTADCAKLARALEVSQWLV